jgi:hypothetical protein
MHAYYFTYSLSLFRVSYYIEWNLNARASPARISKRANLRAMLQVAIYVSLLGLSTFSLFSLARLARQPGCREQKEAYAGADRTGVIWPRSAQESGVAIVSRGNNGDSGRTVEVSPSTQQYQNGIRSTQQEQGVPFSLIVDHKFEYTVPVWGSECNRVFSRGPRDRRKSSADMWVQHRKLELHVFDTRIRFPDRGFGVEARDVSGINL